MVSREVIIFAYFLSAIPLGYISIRYKGVWVWPARMFIAEKTLLLLSIPVTRDLINIGFLIAFLLEFIVLFGVVLRLRNQSTIVEMPKHSQVVVSAEKALLR